MNGFERYRRKNLLSQSQLAGILGVTNAAVSKWENGKSVPHADVLIRLSGMYGTTVDALLRRDYPENDLSETKAKEA